MDVHSLSVLKGDDEGFGELIQQRLAQMIDLIIVLRRTDSVFRHPVLNIAVYILLALETTVASLELLRAHEYLHLEDRGVRNCDGRNDRCLSVFLRLRGYRRL